MSFRELSEGTLLYVLVVAAIALVVLAIVYNVRVCYKHALKCGVSKETLKNVIKSSAIFSIVPSIAVVVGLVTLVAVIGIPYSWLRLSVLGSVSYELMASNMALNAMGLDLSSANGEAFGLMMWAMCVGITVPLILNILMTKPVLRGSLKLGEKDVKWGQISQTVFMAALLMTFVIPMFGKGIVELLTFVTSMALALLITFIAQKLKIGWLGGFSLAISMIGAMAASVGFDKLFN